MSENQPSLDPSLLSQLAREIKHWGKELGFAAVGICDVDLSDEEPKLQQWLDKGYHGEMSYMATHGMMRARPAELHPGTVRVISARMDYLPPQAAFAANLKDPTKAYISRYAGGRDYHKLMRNRLKQLGERINQALQDLSLHNCGYRPFVDSAPILERPLAEKAGLGWTGKHSLILSQEAGSWFFIGELLVNLPLPIDVPITEQCGSCVACITSCPTGAIVEPYVVDGRRCISYLTIELQGAIPEEFRPLMGNRIYGCDDCQLVCPVNRAAPLTAETDFHIRPQIKQMPLTALFAWDEATFLKNTEGSAIRRIGHERWQRNIAVALGNAPFEQSIVDTLLSQKHTATPLVAEHIDWALAQQLAKQQTQAADNRKQQRLLRIIEKGLPRDAY